MAYLKLKLMLIRSLLPVPGTTSWRRKLSHRNSEPGFGPA
jgi:hypothetical protein